MTDSVFRVFVAGFLLVCGGCVQSLSHHAMSAHQPSWTPQDQYIGTIKVGKITAKEDQDVFRKTVEQSLADHRLLARSDTGAKYKIDVGFEKIESVDNGPATIDVRAEISYALWTTDTRTRAFGERVVISKSESNPTGTTIANTRGAMAALAVLGGGAAISSGVGTDPAAMQYHRTLREFAVREALERIISRFMIDPK